MSKNSCVVTGATGFVGKNLLSYLTNYINEVIPVSLRNGIDTSVFASCSSIVHLAGKAHDTNGSSANDQEVYDRINYELTKKLFDIFLNSDAEKFIFISSVKAVSDSPVGIVTEDFVPNPKTAYGISKRKAENYLLSRNLPANKHIYILRPCMIHGPGNKGNLNLLYNLIQKGVPYPLAAYENKRSFLTIENLCFTIKELLLRNNINDGIYNVADNKSLSTNRLIELISQALKKKNRKLKINKKIIQALAKIGDITFLPFNSEKLKKLVTDYEVSNKKLVKALGIPLPVDSEEGLKKTLLSFRS